jgi:hypothetical protein
LTSDPKPYEVPLDFGFRVPLDSDEMGFKANHILEFGTLKASFMKKDQNLCPNSQSLFPPISLETIRNIFMPHLVKSLSVLAILLVSLMWMGKCIWCECFDPFIHSFI